MDNGKAITKIKQLFHKTVFTAQMTMDIGG